MRQLIDLKIDYAFKLIFGKEGNEPVLIAFLNAALKLPPDNRITNVTILNSEINKENKEDKKSVLGIRAVTDEGIQINIEIQLANQYDMERRTLYYWAKMYTLQMRERLVIPFRRFNGYRNTQDIGGGCNARSNTKPGDAGMGELK